MSDIAPKPEYVLDASRTARESRLLKLWEHHRSLAEILRNAGDDEEARDQLYSYFSRLERDYDEREEVIHPLEWDVARECLRVARTILTRRSQRLTGFNLVGLLRRLADPSTAAEALQGVEPGFLAELERLWSGCQGKSGIYRGQRPPHYHQLEGREAALARGRDLERMARRVQSGYRRFPTGMEPAVVKTRQANRRYIQETLGVGDEQWHDWRWQVRHVIRDAETLTRLVDLTAEEREAVDLSHSERLPFGITPYYLHLMDRVPEDDRDLGIRRQVIPPREYVERISAGRRRHETSFDFMLERDTSPCDLVTRRYPLICILKPYNTCAQICVYCQRNWEIEGCLDPKAMAPADKIEDALDYIEAHPALKEVLVTGGDPLILSDSRLRALLDRLAAIPHVERIRLGSRTPVVLPMRITEELADLLASYRMPGRRDVCLVTHFEHAFEVTPEAAQAVQRLRQRGLAVYNQVVFTFANSRRFELVALRRILGLIGVEPYYTFTPKGKEETEWYRIPIARLLQARKEEARITPGIWRTDDSVFNVPRLGKNYLNRQQDHDVIAFLPDGRRVYEFHPWEKKLALVDTYLHIDISIQQYLDRLATLGEKPDDYASIWYYY